MSEAETKGVVVSLGGEHIAANYDGASIVHGGLKDWNAPSSDADSSLEFDRDELINRSYDSYRNNAIARAAIDTRVQGIVGTGLKFQSSINADYLPITEEQARELEDLIEQDFDQWARSEDSDIARRSNFYQLQSVLQRDTELSGDAFALLPYLKRRSSPWGLKVQLIDGQRVSNPNKRMNTTKLAFGIGKDRFGAPVRIYIQEGHPGSTLLDNKWKWSPREIYGRNTGRKNVIHYVIPERAGQTRGVPTLSPVLALLKEINTYVGSEVRASVVTSYFTAFLKKKAATGGGPALPVGESASGAKLKDGEIAMGAASIVELPSWVEDIVFADPTRPKANAQEFIHFLMELVGGATGIPFEVLLKKFASSYSASRAARLEAASTFQVGRRDLASGFCQPVLSAFIDEGVASGRYVMPGYDDPHMRLAYQGGKWIGDKFAELDEFKAWQAAKLAYELEAKTLSTITQELTGESYKTVQKQRKKEAKYASDSKPNGDSTGAEGPLPKES